MLCSSRRVSGVSALLIRGPLLIWLKSREMQVPALRCNVPLHRVRDTRWLPG
jgi:hypothetical protein